MNIELINDSKIKFILTDEDLTQRDIKVSELSYGSEKATSLFKEIIGIAHKQFGFSVGDSPFMIEAIPIENNSLCLIISKVDDPEELDTRFSSFSPSKNDVFSKENTSAKDKFQKANEILNMLNSFKEALNQHAGKIASLGNQDTAKSDTEKNELNILIIFCFDEFDKLISLAKVLNNKYHGTNSIYRKDKQYFLTIRKCDHTPEEFNQICNIICEFGERCPRNMYTEIYLKEHCEIILKDDALMQLSNV